MISKKDIELIILTMKDGGWPVEDKYEYIVKVNGIARAVPKKCFKLIEELLNK